MIALVEVDPVDVEIAADALWCSGSWPSRSVQDTTAASNSWTSLGDDVEAIAVALLRCRSWPHRFVEVDDRVVDTWRSSPRRRGSPTISSCALRGWARRSPRTSR
ncbi:MAG: hypothetical protein R2713_17750 [Ilumatobacteraceae bacterium]